MSLSWQDFDLEGRLKVPVGFYLILLYILRGYFIWIMSISHRKEPDLIIGLIYPDAKMFISTLLVGIPVLLVYALMLSQGRINKPAEHKLWRYSFVVVALTLVADLSMQVWSLWQSHLLVHFSAPLIFITGFYSLWYWIKSKAVKRFVENWIIIDSDIDSENDNDSEVKNNRGNDCNKTHENERNKER